MDNRRHCGGIIPLRYQDGIWQTLLVHHTKGSYWSFSKGHVDASEDIKEAAKRELFEETNLEVVELLNCEGIDEDYYCESNGQEVHKFITYFLAVVKGVEKIKEPHEVKEIKWFSLDEAEKKISYSQTKVLIEHIKERLKKNDFKEKF